MSNIYENKTPKEIRELKAIFKENQEEAKEDIIKQFETIKKFGLPDELKNKVFAVKRKELKKLRAKKVEVIDSYDTEKKEYKKSEKEVTLDMVNSGNEDARFEFEEVISKSRGIDLDKYDVPQVNMFIDAILLITNHPIEIEGNL